MVERGIPSPVELPRQRGQARKAGRSGPRLSHGWLPVHSAAHGPRLAGGKTSSCSVSVFVPLSLSLASPHPFISFPLALSLPLSLSHLPPPSLIFPPTSVPSPVHPSLKPISCFLILSSSSELRTTLGRPPLLCVLPSTLSSNSLSFPPLLQVFLPSPYLLFLLSLPHSPQSSLSRLHLLEIL